MVTSAYSLNIYLARLLRLKIHAVFYSKTLISRYNLGDENAKILKTILEENWLHLK